jgi:hypothetical protein
MNTTDELLIAVLARLIKLEATTQTLTKLSLEHMADSERWSKALAARRAVGQLPQEPSMRIADWFEVFEGERARHMQNQIDSISVQFPQFEKFFRGHATIAESDLKTLDQQLKQDN